MADHAKVFSLYRSIAGLLLGATLLFVGQGIFLILAPLKLAADGLPPLAISAVGSAYFAGIVSGAWLSDRIIRSVGNVRAYGGFVAVIICAALSLSLTSDAPAWAVIRFLHGWAAAGTFLAIESWLHAATPNQWRGRVIGAYTALSLAGLGAGQLLINAYSPQGSQSVDLGALVFALGIVPIVLSKANAPPLEPLANRSLVEIYRHSPLGAAGAVTAGLLMGAFWALGPVFATALDPTPQAASIFMASAIFGGFFLVLPLGRISDRLDRRIVIAAAAGAGCAASLATLIMGRLDWTPLLPLTILYGGVIFSLYPLSLSHAADHISDGEDMLAVTRGLLLANGFGMALGPLLAGQLIAATGRSGFFLFAAICTGGIASLALWRITQRPAAPPEERKAFVPIAETTPAALSLDPRLEEPQGELDLSRNPSAQSD